jgi:hypothetical protein
MMFSRLAHPVLSSESSRKRELRLQNTENINNNNVKSNNTNSIIAGDTHYTVKNEFNYYSIYPDMAVAGRPKPLNATSMALLKLFLSHLNDFLGYRNRIKLNDPNCKANLRLSNLTVLIYFSQSSSDGGSSSSVTSAAGKPILK